VVDMKNTLAGGFCGHVAEAQRGVRPVAHPKPQTYKSFLNFWAAKAQMARTALSPQPNFVWTSALAIWHKPRPCSLGMRLAGSERVSGDLCILSFKNLSAFRHYRGLQNHV
jgi:hypothetical protein